MKRTKQLTILLLILAVLCLAIVVATGGGAPHGQHLRHQRGDPGPFGR